jgi:hypothetical protein
MNLWEFGAVFLSRKSMVVGEGCGKPNLKEIRSKWQLIWDITVPGLPVLSLVVDENPS